MCLLIQLKFQIHLLWLKFYLQMETFCMVIMTLLLAFFTFTVIQMYTHFITQNLTYHKHPVMHMTMLLLLILTTVKLYYVLMNRLHHLLITIQIFDIL